MASEVCNVCFNEMAARREFPCRHALCLVCVRNLIEMTGRSSHLSCPMCRGLFSIAVVPKERADQPQYVREKYKQEIKKAQDVYDVINHKGKIMGMTVLGNDLFVVCKSDPGVIFQYDISFNREGPWIPAQLKIAEMKWPRGIAANEISRCLYITDWNELFGGRLWRYQIGQESNQEDPVANLDVQPFGVSVSQRTDEVLVTCATPANIFAKRGWIYIYKPSGPVLRMIRKIEFPDLEIPRHSILTASSKFVVCHGWNTKSHGVTSYLYGEAGEASKISFYGKVSGGGNGEHEMNRPLSMILDEEGLILVVDYYNHRIQLLTENLQLVRHLITSGITYPRHICLHSQTGRLYVGQEDGNVQIFDALLR